MGETDKQPITSRAAVIAQIEQRLDGKRNDSALASWAFDRFYAEELGEERYETGAEAVIVAALDALMFNDDPGFTLHAEDLRALVARLQAQ